MAENFNPRPRKEGDNDLVYCSCYRFISIHALVKRATAYQAQTRRPPEISIHALAKRATQVAFPQQQGSGNFNPRPRKEGDRLLLLFLQYPPLFQSTPSQRGRLLNSTQPLVTKAISIHALAKRATLAVGIGVFVFIIFQSTPSQRGRPMKLLLNLLVAVFQSTPSQRGRQESTRQ